ncbi:MAG: hypothetical protein F4Y73_15420 [Gemmatimonadetes bacterium]|nr:hypothetical protein [Gemmatimonadota bacterium]
MDQVKSALSALTPGEPATHRGLTVVPLTTKLRSGLRYLLLEDGLRRDLVTIREVSEGGSVPELTVANRADVPVLIVDGEELVGAKQNRVANLTMLVPAAKTTDIPVSCVEAGRWAYNRRDFGVSDRVQNARGRAEKLQDVRASIRTSGRRASDQGRVWSSIDEEAAALEAASPTAAMRAIFERHADKLDEHVEALEARPDQVGAIFAMGGQRFGLDLFDSPSTFAAFFPKLTRSYAIETLRSRRGHTASVSDPAHSFVQAVIDGRYDDHPAVGLGRDVGIVGAGMVAGALVHDDTVVHLTAFSEPGRHRERPEGTDYAPYRSRRDSLRRRYAG